MAIIAIDLLKLGDSPRLAGENVEHTRALAESDAVLPPVIVHRKTMRVIDGMHRLRAAKLRGQRDLAVEFFDGDDESAFLIAVESNIRHGLPLSIADREAAATRIIASHPHLSDRAIATATGLAAKTVRNLRVRTGAAEATVRRGRDGRHRPLNSADGRRRASEIIGRSPETSLREVARQAGISPATARDVRNRMQRGDDPVPPSQRGLGGKLERSANRRRSGGEPGRGTDARDRTAIVESLCQDPSLRFNQAGRDMLRWLAPRAAGPDGWEAHASALPPHCSYMLLELAQGCASAWLEFAEELEQSLRRSAEAVGPTAPTGLGAPDGQPRISSVGHRDRSADDAA